MTMPVAASDLARAADQAMQAGRLEEAAALWARVLAQAPDHPRALLHLGQHALHQRDLERAQALLDRAAQVDPANPGVALNQSFVFRAGGDAQGEMAALTRALTIDPYFLPALLAKAELFEKLGKPRRAAKIYADALKIAPTVPPPWLTASLDKASGAVAANRAELDAYLATRLERTGEEARFAEAKDVMIGAKKLHLQQPTLLHYPGLPAINFYPREQFPWLAQVEAATATIRDELTALLREQAGDFAPYVTHADGVPLNQWAELNHSPKWSAYFLWRDGKRVEDHAARCPKTTALLESLPLAQVPGAAPSIFFSTLAPKTLIPPHTGVTNTRLVVHLPLVVPPDCWFRVGNDTRAWKDGEAWIFDDSIEHEAWNGSDVPRIILIFDIWNPLLSATEQTLVSGLLAGVQDYYAGE